MKRELKRRNLSGIWLFDKYPEDTEAMPTCLEDCRKETREAWLRQIDDGEYLDHITSSLKETKERIDNLLTDQEKEAMENLYPCLDIEQLCCYIATISDTFGISEPHK
jgi:hypothetical protein